MTTLSNVSIAKLHAYVDECVDKTVQSQTRPNKNQLIVLSGGSASNVGTFVEAMERMGVINDARLQLDSEAIIDSGAVPEFTEIASRGYKHPEKLTDRSRKIFHYLLIDAADYYLQQLEKKGVSGGTIVVDDHCENILVPMALAWRTKNKGGKNETTPEGETGYVCVARDPRLGIDSAIDRALAGGGAIAPKLQLDTYRLQPKNWERLSQCRKFFDVAVLADMNYAYGKTPPIVAQRIARNETAVLDHEKLAAFNCAKDIPEGAASKQEVFPNGTPDKQYRQSIGGGPISKKDVQSFSFEDALDGQGSFVERISSNMPHKEGSQTVGGSHHTMVDDAFGDAGFLDKIGNSPIDSQLGRR